MVFELRGKKPYSCCLVRCCFQDLFNIARNILVKFPSSFFSISFVSVHVVHPHSSTDKTLAWKKSHSILLGRLDFYMIDNLSIAAHVFTRWILISFSVDETQLPGYVKLPTNFRCSLFRVEVAPSWLNPETRFFCIQVGPYVSYRLL